MDGPDLGSKVLAWRKHLELGARLHRQYNKLIVFTEIGYCSGHCKRTHTPSPADYATHAEHYLAVFEAFRNVTYSGSGANGWFLGSFWWNVRVHRALRTHSLTFAMQTHPFKRASHLSSTTFCNMTYWVLVWLLVGSRMLVGSHAVEHGRPPAGSEH